MAVVIVWGEGWQASSAPATGMPDAGIPGSVGLLSHNLRGRNMANGEWKRLTLALALRRCLATVRPQHWSPHDEVRAGMVRAAAIGSVTADRGRTPFVEPASRRHP